jgi:RND superfamily putative drug exporter
MELLGDKNWWIPKWLDRILPRIDVEGHHGDVSALDEGSFEDDIVTDEPAHLEPAERADAGTRTP